MTRIIINVGLSLFFLVAIYVFLACGIQAQADGLVGIEWGSRLMVLLSMAGIYCAATDRLF